MTKLKLQNAHFLANLDASVSTEQEVEILVIGPMCWGRGASVHEAKKHAKKNGPGGREKAGMYTAFLVPKGTNEKGEQLAYCGDLGGICYRTDMIGVCLGTC